MKTADEIRDRLGILRTSLELREELLADYMRARDWHGCEDAASDIRDREAAIAALEWVLGNGAVTAEEIPPSKCRCSTPDPTRRETMRSWWECRRCRRHCEPGPPATTPPASWVVGDAVQDAAVPRRRSTIRRGTVSRLPTDRDRVDVVAVR